MRTRTKGILLIVAVALAARLGAMLVLPDSFMRNPGADPDSYARFAHHLATEGTYGSAKDQPSAHRPPGYPMLLLPWCRTLPIGAVGVGGIVCLHLAATAVLVTLTWFWTEQLGLSRFAWFAALLVALDPLLVRQSSLIMSETVFCAWFAGLLVLTRPALDAGASAWQTRVVAGLVLSAAALTRPIAWAVWLGLAAAFLPLANRWVLFRRWAMCLTIALLTSLPWALRNQVSLGQAVFTTTHGGYTLWLGQNPVFYREVVAGPYRRWQDSPGSFEHWTAENTRWTHGMSETERDRFFFRNAVRWMTDNPKQAVNSVCYHIRSLWALAPRYGPRELRAACTVWSAGVFLLALIGLCHRCTWRWPACVLPVALVSLTLVHAFYWSDIRMRAPLVIVVAVLAAKGWKKLVDLRRSSGENGGIRKE